MTSEDRLYIALIGFSITSFCAPRVQTISEWALMPLCYCISATLAHLLTKPKKNKWPF